MKTPPVARLLGAIPNRLQLAGGWIDQPFVSKRYSFCKVPLHWLATLKLSTLHPARRVDSAARLKHPRQF